MLFGTGIGSSGRAIQQHTHKLATEAEITQNQYVEVLLENGLIGAVLCLMAVVVYLYDTRRDKLAWAITLMSSISIPMMTKKTLIIPMMTHLFREIE